MTIFYFIFSGTEKKKKLDMFSEADNFCSDLVSM